MTPHEAERLLGGYATGTLSETERKELFAAALEDQALFEALADEEHLRALLEDPGARSQLLASLGAAPMASRSGRPFWFRPAGLGLAATVLVSVGIGLSLRHIRTNEPAIPTLSELRSEPAPPVPPVAKPAPAAAPEPRPQARRMPAEALPKEPVLHPTTPAPAAPSPVPRNEAPPVEVIGSTATVDQTASASGMSMSQDSLASIPARDNKQSPKAESKADATPAQSSPAARDFSAGAFFAPGSVPTEARKSSPSPTWQLSTQSSGAFLLKVRWSGKGRLTLLQKSSSGELRMAPASTQALDGGRSESTFTGIVAPHDTLDLLQMPTRGEDSTPPFQARIWPIKKN